MDKLTLAAAVFSKTERAAQELALLKQNGEIIGKLSSPAHTPAEFLKVVNSYFKNLAGKSFKPKDVAVYGMYNKHRFLHSIFAIKRPYGFLMVIVGGTEVILRKETENLSIRPIERFRVYLRPNVFALCTYEKNRVITATVFKERLSPTGDYTEDVIVSFLRPMRFEEMESKFKK